MGALIKLVPQSRQLSYLKFIPETGVEYQLTPNNLGLRLRSARALYATGKDEGMEIEEGTVKANQTIHLYFGNLTPDTYEILVSPSAELCQKANVSAPSILCTGKTHQLVFTVNAFKSFKLGDLEELATLYLID